MSLMLAGLVVSDSQSLGVSREGSKLKVARGLTLASLDDKRMWVGALVEIPLLASSQVDQDSEALS